MLIFVVSAEVRSAAARTKLVKPRTSGTRHPRFRVSHAKQISVDAIDWSFAIRSIYLDHVERLAGAEHLPAIKVWERRSGKYFGIDGYHRWRVAKDKGQTKVAAITRQFPAGPEGQKEFEIECVRSNTQHGLPLTRQERDQAIIRIWTRWGRTSRRHDGLTLEKLGQLFNLTRPRIHQIVTTVKSSLSGHQATKPSTQDCSALPSDLPIDVGPLPQEPSSTRRAGTPRPGGFSSFARFSNAARQLSMILNDSEFLEGPLVKHSSEVIQVLNELEALISKVERRAEFSDFEDHNA